MRRARLLARPLRALADVCRPKQQPPPGRVLPACKGRSTRAPTTCAFAARGAHQGAGRFLNGLANSWPNTTESTGSCRLNLP